MNLKFLILLIILSSCTSENNNLTKFHGTWKVSKIQSLIPGVYNGLEEDIKNNNSCVNSKVTIKDNSIFFNDKRCDFINCTNLNSTFEILKVVDDKNKEISYDEINTHKTIGLTLINQIEKNFSQEEIKVFFTDCATGYGDERVKILVLKNDKIVIFQYYNFIILEK